MSGSKATALLIVFVVAGAVFIGVGMLFLSERYLKNLSDAYQDERKRKRAVLSGKICGFAAVGIGGLTIVCGIIVRLVPSVFQYMALVYVIALIAAFLAISSAIKAGGR
ncbi:MAG: hypothetical protein K2H09_06845 [Treponemataceae bacterium]|nr:hypothetical protein [Treponemataceae bacterium]